LFVTCSSLYTHLHKLLFKTENTTTDRAILLKSTCTQLLTNNLDIGPLARGFRDSEEPLNLKDPKSQKVHKIRR